MKKPNLDNNNKKDSPKKTWFRILFPYIGAFLINPLTIYFAIEYLPQLFK